MTEPRSSQAELREPMRQAANSTTATTAGLMPWNTPCTSGRSPKARYSPASRESRKKAGRKNSRPAISPPRRPCSSQPV